MAEKSGVPLVVKRASDLLSKWVGDTEKLIANAFRDARDQKAILFIDEADSFLQDRREARASWEVTQVNELLVQMEQFDGVLFMATNFAERLDQAAFRRFALKVEFRPLTTDQRVELFAALLGTAVSHCADEAGSLARLEGLTVGDYAVVARRFRALALEPGVKEAVAALREEHALKGDARARIGF